MNSHTVTHSDEAGDRRNHTRDDALFGHLIDAVEEYAIFMLAPDGTVMTWNKGAHRIKGYTAAEILGQHFSIFYTAEDNRAGKPERELADAIAHGQCRDEGWRVRKDGSRFWANVTITAIVDGTGNLDGFAKITRDDTDRRQFDTQLRELERLADRERIAGAMHETVVRRLFDASLIMEGVLGLVSNPAATERIRAAVDSIDTTLKEIRAIVTDLRP